MRRLKTLFGFDNNKANSDNLNDTQTPMIAIDDGNQRDVLIDTAVPNNNAKRDRIIASVSIIAFLIIAAGAAVAIIFSRSSGAKSEDDCNSNSTGRIRLSYGVDTFYYNASAGNFISPNMTVIDELPCYVLMCAVKGMAAWAIAEMSAFLNKTKAFNNEICTWANTNFTEMCDEFAQHNYTLAICNQSSNMSWTNKSCDILVNEVLIAKSLRRCTLGLFAPNPTSWIIDSQTIINASNGQPASIWGDNSGNLTVEEWTLKAVAP